MISSIMPLEFHTRLAPVVARAQLLITEEEHRGKPVTGQELQVGQRGNVLALDKEKRLRIYTAAFDRRRRNFGMEYRL